MFAMARRKRRTFTPEQKADPVRLVRQVGSIGKVAQDLDLTETALREWVRQAEEPAASGAGLTAAERKELEQLRRDNKRLEMESDFLRKAAAFFARDENRPS